MKKTVLGRPLKKIGSFFMILTLVFALSGCHTYDGPTKEIGNLTIRLGSNEKYAMAVSWKWDGDPDNTVIEIPEEYKENVPIDSIGGAGGTNAPLTLFYITSDSKAKYSDIDLNTNYSTDEMVFTVKLSKNIGKVHFFSQSNGEDLKYVPIDQEDGSVIFYKILLIVECDERNENFYSKDGKLYNRKTGDLVKSIPYPEDPAKEDT